MDGTVPFTDSTGSIDRFLSIWRLEGVGRGGVVSPPETVWCQHSQNNDHAGEGTCISSPMRARKYT